VGPASEDPACTAYPLRYVRLHSGKTGPNRRIVPIAMLVLPLALLLTLLLPGLATASDGQSKTTPAPGKVSATTGGLTAPPL